MFYSLWLYSSKVRQLWWGPEQTEVSDQLMIDHQTWKKRTQPEFLPATASLSAQKDFLGGGVVKNDQIFVKQILLHHIYANILEFIWTKCVTHLLVFLI